MAVDSHGGAFSAGGKAEKPVSSDVLAAGIAVVRTNDRLTGTDIWPAQAGDCRAAVGWLRRAGCGGLAAADRRFASARSVAAGAVRAIGRGASGGIGGAVMG